MASTSTALFRSRAIFGSIVIVFDHLLGMVRLELHDVVALARIELRLHNLGAQKLFRFIGQIHELLDLFGVSFITILKELAPHLSCCYR